MHNVEVLVKGKARCTLHVHPGDAARRGWADGTAVVVRSAAGSVVVPVELTEGLRPGVVSLPHGWGHDHPELRLRVAARVPGVNSNLLSDHTVLDPLSGTSALTAIPVQVTTQT
jgi:anaerobic selenocysteine-containing dehydrogenase